jgi:hypothetical protein
VTFTVPTSTDYTVERGDQGIVAWAVQRALNEIGTFAKEDGFYGEQTAKIVKSVQLGQGLAVDGKFGPQTSRRFAELLEETEEVSSFGGPANLVRGVVEAESGGLIGAVNASVPGGIDCSYCQRRVFDGATQEQIKRAFDGRYQMRLLARTLRSRHDAFFGMKGARTHTKAWRLATLNHNYPAAALKIAQVGVGGLTPYYTTPQKWVEAIGAKFPDGVPIRTPLEWCQHYALAAPAHNDPGVTWRFVVL